MEITFKVSISYSSGDYYMPFSHETMRDNLVKALEVSRQDGQLANALTTSVEGINVQVIEQESTVAAESTDKPHIRYRGTLDRWQLCYEDLDKGTYWLIPREGGVRYLVNRAYFTALIFDK